ncbi:hypothetical protein AJ80_00966 [Polytolypa hystricis UAMH7299]|uniref:SGNH hydrolase-type esterase domain-containing protein n=1 Tax=Polytolypa hystricis (strain UAMH7299) TaxID=1447883 RepID=A0A2B7YZZ5_POLH7|nr:hypothetical protein AJ80_00966 [Polytolypa hystricis UAMH7299]
MRFLSKVYVLGALAVCCMLFSAWSLRSSRFASLASSKPQQKNMYKYRLVVFGDSWSDDKLFKNPSQGKVWPEWLCSQFSCVRDNMAESVSSAGVIVDSSELGIFKAGKRTTRAVPDLKTQISRWIQKEKEAVQELPEDRLKPRQRNTIFSLSVGVWDIRRLIGGNVATSKAAIRRSVATIFDELKRLTELSTAKDMKVILMNPVDVTLLPAYDPMDGHHREAIELFQEWTNELKRLSEGWEHGSIFYVDTNSFLADQIRERQLWVSGYLESADLEKEGVGWEDVDRACVGDRKKWILWGQEICDLPEKYLFWDDMHLGATAHKLLGELVFQGIGTEWLNKGKTAA